MRAAILIGSGSISTFPEKSARSPRSPVGVNDTGAGVPFCRRSWSIKLSVYMKERTDLQSPSGKRNPLRRVRSDTDLIISKPPGPCSSRKIPPATLAEVENDDLVAEAEEQSSGGGKGNGGKVAVGGGRGGRDGGNRGLASYYLDMLKADPTNPLILRNYGKYLHEVEGDLKAAEEYYSRAILASPDDGELLSLLGRLLWESQRDCQRAEIYHERAAAASPDDCYVLGSYAHFLWDAEEEDDAGRVTSSQPLEAV